MLCARAVGGPRAWPDPSSPYVRPKHAHSHMCMRACMSMLEAARDGALCPCYCAPTDPRLDPLLPAHLPQLRGGAAGKPPAACMRLAAGSCAAVHAGSVGARGGKCTRARLPIWLTCCPGPQFIFTRIKRSCSRKGKKAAAAAASAADEESDADSVFFEDAAEEEREEDASNSGGGGGGGKRKRGAAKGGAQGAMEELRPWLYLMPGLLELGYQARVLRTLCFVCCAGIKGPCSKRPAWGALVEALCLARLPTAPSAAGVPFRCAGGLAAAAGGGLRRSQHALRECCFWGAARRRTGEPATALRNRPSFCWSFAPVLARAPPFLRAALLDAGCAERLRAATAAAAAELC